jgi:hypothetical protein
MSGGILTRQGSKAEGRGQKGRKKVAKHRGRMAVWSDMILVTIPTHQDQPLTPAIVPPIVLPVPVL